MTRMAVQSSNLRLWTLIRLGEVVTGSDSDRVYAPHAIEIPRTRPGRYRSRC
jgi:hypothetical protein